ncbi:MAG: acyl-CoA dehydrogenase family protein [Ferrimicrobium sp.]
MTEEVSREYIRNEVGRLLVDVPPTTVSPEEFRRAQFERGLAFVHFPEGLGGRGESPSLQSEVDAMLAAAGVPSAFAANPIGVGMGAPTLMSQGSHELQHRMLGPLFSGEEIWCQLFSEPGAGSDVASLATRAFRDGDEWVVTGQKVWTTFAHVARWGLLVARSDPEVPKHRGMTYFVLDMHAAGVEVRPLRQITGETEFNEVYLTEVRIPDAYRLGDPGQGWSVAITTLMNERSSIGGVVVARGGGPIAMAIELWRERGARNLSRRDAFLSFWVRAEVLRLTNQRAAQSRVRGDPGPEGSTAKLAAAELNQEIFEFCVDLLGEEGLFYPDYSLQRPKGSLAQESQNERGPAQAYLRSRANSIEGGTSEIMRNILGERVLGLPGEPRGDKELAWSMLPRS